MENSREKRISHTSRSLIEISDYCIQDLGLRYVLIGKFQTDSLEARFGQYRQLAGGQYDVSLRQVFECEKKIRLLSVLKLKLAGQDITLTDFNLQIFNPYVAQALLMVRKIGRRVRSTN